MKLLRILLTTVLLLLSTSVLFAKELKVKVKVKVTAFGEPLAHSYIYINGIIQETADNDGITYLPLSGLKIGDKISASFAGHKSVETIFDAAIKDSKVVTLDLSNNFTLDEIVVKGKTNPVKLYKKKIQRHFGLYYGPFEFDFDIDFKSDEKNYTCSGSTSVNYWHFNRWSKDGYSIYKINNFESTDCDTIHAKHLIAKKHFRLERK